MNSKKKHQMLALIMILFLTGCHNKKVYLPNEYALKCENAPFLYNSQNRKVLKYPVSEFIVQNPYVIFWSSNDKFIIVNTKNGEIRELSSYQSLTYEAKKIGLNSIDIHQFVTFWDISTGYKPYTWPHKKPWWVLNK